MRCQASLIKLRLAKIYENFAMLGAYLFFVQGFTRRKSTKLQKSTGIKTNVFCAYQKSGRGLSSTSRARALV